MTNDRAPKSFAERLVEESPDALMAVDPAGRILSWNRAAETMFGFDTSEAVGQPLTDLIVPRIERREAIRALAEMPQRRTYTAEVTRCRKDGSLLVVVTSMRWVESPGGEPFIAASKTDITALKHLEVVRASEERFRSLLESAPDAMVIVDSDGQIVLVNEQTERMFGYRRAELLGQPVELLMPERFRASHTRHRSGYMGDPHPRGMGIGLELFGLRKDGREFPIEISLSPLKNEQGALVLSAIRDITERKQLESRMHEAYRMKSEFLANMSHELRTPLNAIIGFTELMHKERVGPVSPQHKEYLGDILSSSRHLLQLINDVLDLAKVEAGKMDFRFEQVDSAALAREVCDTLRGLASSKRLDVILDVDTDLGPVEVDPGRVRQILYNYLSNAIKFTPDGGRITIRIAGEGPALFRIDVEDTGVGIPEENRSKLFVPFEQLDSGAGKRYSGTGLGLALTKRIAEAHGGRVSVRSTPGVGSTFSVVLPRNRMLAADDVARAAGLGR